MSFFFVTLEFLVPWPRSRHVWADAWQCMSASHPQDKKMGAIWSFGWYILWWIGNLKVGQTRVPMLQNLDLNERLSDCIKTRGFTSWNEILPVHETWPHSRWCVPCYWSFKEYTFDVLEVLNAIMHMWQMLPTSNWMTSCWLHKELGFLQVEIVPIHETWPRSSRCGGTRGDAWQHPICRIKRWVLLTLQRVRIIMDGKIWRQTNTCDDVAKN